MKIFHRPCTSLCTIVASTDKICGNESKNHTTSKYLIFSMYISNKLPVWIQTDGKKSESVIEILPHSLFSTGLPGPWNKQKLLNLPLWTHWIFQFYLLHCATDPSMQSCRSCTFCAQRFVQIEERYKWAYSARWL